MSDANWDVEQYAACAGCGHQQRNCTCHKIQLHIQPKVCQCSGCGRVRIGKDWVRDDTVKVDVMGFCATCADRAHRKHIREEKAWMRRLTEPGEAPREMTDEDWERFR